MSETSISRYQLELIRDQARRIWQEMDAASAIEGKILSTSEMTTISWIEAVSGFLKAPLKVKVEVPDSDPDTEY